MTFPLVVCTTIICCCLFIDLIFVHSAQHSESLIIIMVLFLVNFDRRFGGEFGEVWLGFGSGLLVNGLYAHHSF